MFSLKDILEKIDANVDPLALIPQRGTAKAPTTGILLHSDSRYFLTTQRRQPQVSLGRHTLTIPPAERQLLIPGVAFDNGLRAITPDEYALFLRGWVSTDWTYDGFSVGYARVHFGPDLAPMAAEGAALMDKLNAELAQVNAKIDLWTPGYVIHNPLGVGDIEQDPSLLESCPVQFVTAMGHKAFASYAAPGWLIACRMEGVPVVPLTLSAEGMFVNSPHCQRIAPYRPGTAPVGERQFNIVSNRVSLLQWLAGPGAMKYLPRSPLKKYGQHKMPPHAQLEELRAATEAWASVVQWEKLTVEQAREEAVKALDDGKFPLFYFSHNGRWFLTPVDRRGMANPAQAAVPMVGVRESLTDVQRVGRPPELPRDGYIVSEPVFQAYYGVASVVTGVTQ